MSESSFSNKQMNIGLIPSVEEVSFTGLHKNYLTVELVGTAIFWGVIGVSAFVIIHLNLWEAPSWLSYALYGILFLLIVYSFVVITLGFKRKKYALRERDIIYQTGLFWRSYTVLPFNRVQHAEVQQGPIERMFDLSRLKIYTAGGSSSDMSIPGLSPAQSQSIKHFIIHQTSGIDEEE